MKFDWNAEKNEWLKKKRGISFEKIIFHLSLGDLWLTADHPNPLKYPGKKNYFVIVDDYIHLVPHVTEKDFIFLKTIIPSRKATEDYFKEQEQKS